MPDPTMSEALKEAYATAPADVITLHTLEFRHPDFAAPIRVVRNFPDQATWLAQDEDGVAAVLAAMDADDREYVGLVAQLEADAPVGAGVLVPFVAIGFNFELPDIDTVPAPELRLIMDNVGRQLTEQLDAAAISQADTTVTYRPYLSNDLSGPQTDPPLTVTLYDVKATTFRVTGRARMSDIGSKPFPAELYTATRFPPIAR